jgi:LacI family transcriptional regulator
MSARRATSYDVAREAGVSRSTVSFVLNGVSSVSISDATKERVLAVAKQLGYSPQAAGRALATQRTMNIGLVFPVSQAGHGFLLDVMGGLTQVTDRNNLRLLVATFQDDSDGNALLELTRAKHIDGLVTYEPKVGDAALSTLVKEGFPVVMIGSLAQEGLYSVDIDNRSAAAEVVRHLLDIGRKRIAYISNAPMVFTAAESRYEGYLDAFRERGLAPEEGLRRSGNFTSESGYEAMADILAASDRRPDAVFVASDTVAFGALKAIHEAGLSIPADIAIAGFDDIPLAAYAYPPLTTVRFSGADEGRIAGEMLLSIIGGESIPNRHREIPAELVIRESTVGDAFGEFTEDR